MKKKSIHFVCLKVLRTFKNECFYSICFTVVFFPFQDYKVHRDEIHSKLVQIMRERLLVHLRGLPQIIESWNRPEDADPQPSQFARSLTKVNI